MNIRASHPNRLLVILLAVVSALVLTPAIAKPSTVHVRGVITGLTASGFTVRTDSGSRTIGLDSHAHIVGVVPSSLDHIKPGTFIGTANVKHHGDFQAQEVVVFPPSMKGTGLGNYPWDLPASGSGTSAMTNGTVKTRQSKGGVLTGHSMMTNGTVKTSSHHGALKLTVNYGKGSKVINVPANVSVVAFVPAKKSAIVKGAHVFVIGKPGNPVSAMLVAVGLHGTVPPM